MKVLGGSLLAAHCPAAAGSIHAQIGNAQSALNWSLRDRDILDIGEIDGHFSHSCDTIANAQTAVGHYVPAFLELKADDGEHEQINQHKNYQGGNGNQ